MTHRIPIPATAEPDHDQAVAWFREMKAKGLHFHPEDDPRTIGNVIGTDFVPLFTPEEAFIVIGIISTMYTEHPETIWEIIDAGFGEGGLS